MTGIIVSIPPTVEVPPGNNANNPASLPPVTYTYALLNIPQTWTAKQTFPLGNISVQAADIVGLATATTFTLTTTGSSGAATYLGGTLNIPQYSGGGGTVMNYLTGLTLSAAGSTATFGVAVGAAMDTTNAVMMSLASAYTKTTGTWAVGSTNGALDTGTIAANTWYHAFVIERLDTGGVDILISISVSAPTMPANYTPKRLIGSMLTDGSAQWVKFIQDGDRFRWSATINDVAAANPGISAVTRTLTVPAGRRVAAEVSATFSATNGGAGTGGIYLSDLLQSDQAASAANATVAGYNDNSTAGHIYAAGSLTSVMTNTSQQIRSRLGVSTADLIFYITTHGWTDTRGR